MTPNTAVVANTGATISGMLIIILVLGIYFLPAIISGLRGHRNAAAIFILNLLLGWAFIGWVISLVWSSTCNVKEKEPPKKLRTGPLPKPTVSWSCEPDFPVPASRVKQV